MNVVLTPLRGLPLALLAGAVAALGGAASADAATPSVLACTDDGAQRLGLERSTPRERVTGDRPWPGAAFSTTRTASERRFRGTTVPRGRTVGSFSATVRPRTFRGTVARTPRLRATPACIPARAPVAVTVDGTLVFAPLDAKRGARGGGAEVDRCGGSVDATGLYAIRRAPACLPKRQRDGHGALVGWARDGIPLFGPTDRGGRALRSRDLDSCHGHTHAVRVDGRVQRRYHYHVTADFPYTVGCFRARPSTWTIGAPFADGPSGSPKPATPAPATPAAPAAPAQPSTPAAPEPALSVTTSPGLRPAFDRDVADYVTRCADGPVDVAVTAPSGTTVSVDGADGASGTFARTVPLRDDQAFTLTVTGDGATTTHHVRCLPQDFPDWTVERNADPEVDFLVVGPNVSPAFAPAPQEYAAVVDDRGTPLWWIRDAYTDMKLLPNGNLAWTSGIGNGYVIDPDAVFEERRLDGTLVATFKHADGPTDAHEMQRLPNGNTILISYVPRDGEDLSAWGRPANARVLDAHIQEVRPDGSVAWSWHSEDHVDAAETEPWFDLQLGPTPTHNGANGWDLVHINSVEPDGDGYIVSLRHTNAVYRIDRATGAIDWKLGGTPTPESLTILGDESRKAVTFGGQHDARRLPDGTLTVFDNAWQTGQFPRAVRYTVDPVAGTATLLESVGDPEIQVATCCGSARKLPAGNWLVSWGNQPLIGEYAPDGTRRLAIKYADRFTYRADPVVGRLTAEQLRTGMDAQHPRPAGG